MEVTFAKDDLDRLESEPTFGMGLPASVITTYRKRMQSIRAAVDERDFYNNKSLHFEKLQGKRRGQHSMRLNDQFRLIMVLEGSGQSKRVKILGVEDYH